jgi:hypothetical protein
MEGVALKANRPSDELQQLIDDLRGSFRPGAPETRVATRDGGLYAVLGLAPSQAHELPLLAELEGYVYADLASLAEYLSEHIDWPCPLPDVVLALDKLYANSAGTFVAMHGAELESELLEGLE